MPGDAQPLPVSVSIVCKDSARTIDEVLTSVSGWAGEIIAVDSGSTDTTLDLLEKHHATIIEHEWLGHVKTKQLALSKCTQPWVLCLDADESVDPVLADSIRETITASDPDDQAGVVAARVNRKIWYRGRYLNHAWQPEWRLRLVRNGAAAWAGLDPHDKLESLQPGRVIDLPGTLKHDSFVSFADQLAKDSGYARLMAANLHAAGKRGSRLRCCTSPLGAFAKQMLVKQAWRDGRAGWLAALSTASATLQKHTMLLELEHVERTKPN
ncbi:MAG: glycosyltransferase involved in cell wall biosynthesis [Phycisphaerales bacterium]|jgi:glycosyltransferase involved in cell wall biosynthesis